MPTYRTAQLTGTDIYTVLPPTEVAGVAFFGNDVPIARAAGWLKKVYKIAVQAVWHVDSTSNAGGATSITTSGVLWRHPVIVDETSLIFDPSQPSTFPVTKFTWAIPGGGATVTTGLATNCVLSASVLIGHNGNQNPRDDNPDIAPFHVRPSVDVSVSLQLNGLYLGGGDATIAAVPAGSTSGTAGFPLPYSGSATFDNDYLAPFLAGTDFASGVIVPPNPLLTAAPDVTFTIAEYYSYNGCYDTATGARLVPPI